jgi:hypothetical protein
MVRGLSHRAMAGASAECDADAEARGRAERAGVVVIAAVGAAGRMGGVSSDLKG